ncbi:MAG: ribonuclease P protein component [Flavobacteriales bacterium]|nr:ribonuclease P protein component [Flavobacteriales bacterium]
MSRYTFGKKEKLCSKLVIDELFKTGKSFKEYPIRVMYLPLATSDTAAKLLISVPKKRFKKAVSRNHIKRLIRETYRLNKPDLIEKWQDEAKYFALAFVYIGNEIPEYDALNKVMKRVLDKLKSISK